MKLYSYFRSSASYRVRIALNIKGIKYDYEPVNLLKAEQRSGAYRALNPLGLLPALALDDGDILAQSLAILEYLEESHPQPPLLPSEPLARARVRAMAATIACEIQPICNIGVTDHLKATFEAGPEEITAWHQHWMPRGFIAVEAALSRIDTPFASGDSPGMADICLVPQVYNARRFEVDLEPYPNIRRISDLCNTLPTFIQAAPDKQPDSTS